MIQTLVMRLVLPSLVAALWIGGCDGTEADPCAGVSCSSHGTCVARGTRPTCDCEAGYSAVGLDCLPEEDGGDGDADGDVEHDADHDGDAAPGSGPLTMLVTGLEITTVRLCDLDGDGLEDNAVADLGDTSADLFAMALSNVANRSILQGWLYAIHLPHVEDLAALSDPAAVLIVFHGGDTDEPADPSDDLSGEEPVYANVDSLDGCGEPLYHLEEAVLEGGALTASGGTLPLYYTQDAAPLRRARVVGNVTPGGAAGEILLCGCIAVSDLGATQAEELLSEFNFLEVLLAGGAAFGLPGLPGLVPDVDLDGDGLEQIELDEELHVARCIDGDRTVISGSDCWADERIADAVSMTTRQMLVGARFAGRTPGWQGWVTGACDEGPPDPSLWDPR